VIISDVRTREVDGDWELRADVRFEAVPAESAPLWFRWPGGVAPPANPGDPFLAATLIPAMAVGEDLRIDAPVTTELLGTAADPLAPILRRWHGYREPAIAAAEARPADAPAAGAGVCFSGGIDSFYSLHKHRETLTHLVFLHGFEIPIDRTNPLAAALANVRAIADEWGKTLLPIASNINDVGHLAVKRLEARGVGSKRFGVLAHFGSELVAIALCLQRVLGRVIVPSSWPYEYLRPNGSHPLMEPNWSTPAMTLELDGCEAGRMDKIRRLGAEAPRIFERLRVCVDKNTRHLNCGRCTKCVPRTRDDVCEAARPARGPAPRSRDRRPLLARPRADRARGGRRRARESRARDHGRALPPQTPLGARYEDAARAPAGAEEAAPLADGLSGERVAGHRCGNQASHQPAMAPTATLPTTGRMSEIGAQTRALNPPPPIQAPVTKALKEFIARRQQKKQLDLFASLEWNPEYG